MAHTDLLIRRAYSHNGIVVVVEIDFMAKTVSLVDRDGTTKHWIFAHRTQEYIMGWRNILSAMDHAIQKANALLAIDDEKEKQKMVEMLIALEKARLEKPKDD